MAAAAGYKKGPAARLEGAAATVGGAQMQATSEPEPISSADGVAGLQPAAGKVAGAGSQFSPLSLRHEQRLIRMSKRYCCTAKMRQNVEYPCPLCPYRYRVRASCYKHCIKRHHVWYAPNRPVRAMTTDELKLKLVK